MSESRGKDLKPPVDGMFYDNFWFGTFFRYHNFQNEIDAWESTVPWRYMGGNTSTGKRVFRLSICPNPFLEVEHGQKASLRRIQLLTIHYFMHCFLKSKIRLKTTFTICNSLKALPECLRYSPQS